MRALKAVVGEPRYAEACEWAWRTAEGTGFDDRPIAWPEHLLDVPHDIARAAHRAYAHADRVIPVLLEVSAEMPCYGVLLYLKDHYPDASQLTRDALWRTFFDRLDAEDPRVADPVSYAVWGDFFADPACAREAWDRVLERGLRFDSLWAQRVMDISGPLPWAWKVAVFEQLITDRGGHGLILRSLIGTVLQPGDSTDSGQVRRWARMLDLRSEDGYLREAILQRLPRE